jgi:hypothetical protein
MQAASDIFLGWLRTVGLDCAVLVLFRAKSAGKGREHRVQGLLYLRRESISATLVS